MQHHPTALVNTCITISRCNLQQASDLKLNALKQLIISLNDKHKIIIDGKDDDMTTKIVPLASSFHRVHIDDENEKKML